VTAIRGIPIDPTQTQVGFGGTDQEVIQQQREEVEGRLLAQRWSPCPSQTLPPQAFRMRIPCIGSTKRSTSSSFCLLLYGTQIVEAMACLPLHSLVQGPQCE